MTAALSREVTAARQAMDLSDPYSEEYDQARRWRDTVRAQLITALGGNRFRPRMPRCRQPLPFFPALRRVHRPEVA